jgi:hypothetical protein
MNKDHLRQIVNVVAVVATLAVNGLANALPLNGQTTGQISDRFQVYFVPAGYVFTIWGLIYAGLVAFAVYQALPSQRHNGRLRRVGYLFALSCLANGLWIFLWHYEFFVATLLVMVGLLLLLIAIYLRLGIGREPVGAAEKWLVHRPFSLYLGWISVATIANATAVLDYLQWQGWGIAPQLWALVMLAAGVVIATAVAWHRRDLVYPLVMVWAYVGIAVRQADTPLVAGTAWFAVLLLALLVLVLWHSQRPTTSRAIIASEDRR